MDCQESIILLSEYHDGSLSEPVGIEVRIHLDGCPPCADIYRELDEIISWAIQLRENQQLDFPDENTLWLRMGLVERKAY